MAFDHSARPGSIVTVEPGLYFIPALLNDPARREKYRDCVNWPLADRCLGLGGVRIEDNILVTAGEPENLTAAIPKALGQLVSSRRGAVLLRPAGVASRSKAQQDCAPTLPLTAAASVSCRSPRCRGSPAN